MKKNTFLWCFLLGFTTLLSAQHLTTNEELEILENSRIANLSQVSITTDVNKPLAIQAAEPQISSATAIIAPSKIGSLKAHYKSQNRDVLANIIPTAGATETFTPNVGDFFFDPGGPGGGPDGTPGNYPNCGCVTLTTLAGVTEIEFLDYEVFGTFDWLRVYDGADNTGTILFDNSSGGINQGANTFAQLLAANGGSGIFTGTSGNFFFEFNSTTVVNRLGWEVEILATGGGGGGCTPNDLTTFFTGGNSFAGNMFDVTASGADDVLIDKFDVNVTAGSGTISVYTRPGSYVGFEGAAAGWTLMGSEVVTGAGSNLPTQVNVGGLTIPAGQTYGFYVTVSDYPSLTMNYTNGDNVFSDANITIATGVGKGNPDFTGSTFASRSWNGTIYYCSGTGGGGGGGGGPCAEVSPSAGFVNGFTSSTDQAQRIATDLTVPVNTDFNFERITTNFWTNPGALISNFEVKIYDDAGGLPNPASIVNTQNVVPTSQTFIGSAFGFDISEFVLDLAPVLLNGQAGNTTRYWVGLTATVNSGSGFWDATNTILNLQATFSADGGLTWAINSGWDQVYNFEGTCTDLGGGGGTCVSTPYTATGLPADIDGADTSTADCIGAPNLYPVTVSDAGIIGTDAVLEDVTINITHTWSGDLELYLRSPSGVELMLWDNVGGSGDNFTNTQFQDGGIPSTGSTAPHTGVYAPVGGTFAAAFAGEDINGDWQLKVCDTAAGDTGTVDSFTITFCIENGGPTNNWECADAIALTCGDVVAGSTTGATNSGGNASPDVFYSYTGSGAVEFVTISLCGGGTTYDSLLRVFASCGNLGLGSEIALNDDFCGLQSEVTFESDGVSEYIIMVEGFGSGSGDFSLAITCELAPPPPACGGIFTDTGGVGGNYENNADEVWTISPDVSGDAVTVIFTSFDVESGWDALYVFDGPDTSSPLISSGNPPTNTGFPAGGFYGTTNPGPFTSTHPTGALTFRFLSDGSVTRAGWIADILCLPIPPPNDLIVNAIDVDQFTQPYTDPMVRLFAATNELLNPVGCSIAGTNGVWYKFTATADGSATASITTPSGASAVIFYSAPDENVSNETNLTYTFEQSNQCGPGTSATAATVAGQSYYLFVLNTGGESDVVVDISNALSTSDNTIEGFTYYPNPMHEVLHLRANSTIESVVIYTILGQKVIDQNIEATTSQLNVSNLSTGAYLMKVVSEGQTGIYRLIKK